MRKMIKYILSALFLLGLTAVGTASNVAYAIKTDANTVSIEKFKEESVEVTFEEMLSEFARDNDLTVEQAKAYFPTDDTYVSRGAISYRYFSRTLNATNWYRPMIKLYVKLEDGEFNQVLRADMVRPHGYVFQGEVYTNIEHGSQLYYIASGDFYHQGTMTVSVGFSIPYAGATFNFSISGANNHAAYLYMDGHFYNH